MSYHIGKIIYYCIGKVMALVFGGYKSPVSCIFRVSPLLSWKMLCRPGLLSSYGTSPASHSFFLFLRINIAFY